jgi:hypothetical protein
MCSSTAMPCSASAAAQTGEAIPRPLLRNCAPPETSSLPSERSLGGQTPMGTREDEYHDMSAETVHRSGTRQGSG